MYGVCIISLQSSFVSSTIVSCVVIFLSVFVVKMAKIITKIGYTAYRNKSKMRHPSVT